MRNTIYWVEIPAKNLDRAKKFYETIFDIQMIPVPLPRGKYAIFPLDKDGKGAGGAIVEGVGYEPGLSGNGAVVYLHRDNDLNVPLSKVEKAGGKILMPKTKNSDNPDTGYIAQFTDSEGNRIGLHSDN